jgi:uncharacterized cupredoxin-like copper-binding protein
MVARRGILSALAAFGAVAVSATAVGCGDDGPYAAAEDGTLRLTLDEFRLRPQRIRVPAGRVQIVARNRGVLTHNVAVVQFDRPVGEDEEHQYARTRTAHPGQTVSVSTQLRAGKYRLVCTIANHDNLGQYGELNVVGRGHGRRGG